MTTDPGQVSEVADTPETSVSEPEHDFEPVQVETSGPGAVDAAGQPNVGEPSSFAPTADTATAGEHPGIIGASRPSRR